MLAGEQGKIFLAAMVIGGVAGFLYDWYRVLRLRTNLRGLGGSLGDLLFWVVTGTVVFFLLMVVNQGELRLYVFLGLFGGAFFYFTVLGRAAFRLVDFVWHLAGRIEDLLFNVAGRLGSLVLFPVHRSFLLILWPLKASCSGGRYLGRRGTAQMQKRGGELLTVLRTRAAGWKHLRRRNKK